MVHFGALQHLSDGKYVPYEATLRVVTHEDNKSSKQPYTKTRKPPVWCCRVAAASCRPAARGAMGSALHVSQQRGGESILARSVP